MPPPRIAAAVQQLTGVFRNEPDRHLSLADAERLTGLDAPSCQMVLEALQDAHFLTRAKDGRFVRSDRTPGAE